MSGWVAVGRLFRARGNRGELAGEIYSSQPGRAEKLKEVVLAIEGRERRQARVEKVWFHDGRPIFKFEGIDTISDAERWSGADVLVPEAERAEPEEGEFSHADLIGCGLEDRGKAVGVVIGIEEYGGPPLLKVKAPDGREVLIPFARSICRVIDVKNKLIGAELPEGLMEWQ